MAKETKRKALEAGIRTFYVAGKVRLPKDGLGTPEPNKTNTWLGVRTGFSVETSEGNVVYVSLNGGRSLVNGLIQKPSAEDGKLLQIPIADASKKEMIDKVAEYSVKKANLESNDAKDSKKFIDDLGYLNYLREHLKDGEEVVVTGNVEYDQYEKDGNTRVYRKLDVQNVYLNAWEKESVDKNGNPVPAHWRHEHGATINQTVLIGADAVSKSALKELKEDGQTIINGYVPQYKSKVKNQNGEYVEWKKIVPIPFSFVFKSQGTPEEDVRRLKTLFAVGKNNVWEQAFTLLIVEGYEQGQVQKAEMSEELLKLIKDGIITEEELGQAPVIRGTKRSELVYSKLKQTLSEDGAVLGLGDRAKYTEDDVYAAIPNFEVDEYSFETENEIETINPVDFDEDDLPF